MPDGTLRVEVVGSEAGPYLRARGVRFALPPVGSLRFQPPVVQPPWSDVRNATEFGPDCINAPLGERLLMTKLAKNSEDCLYLNVFAPSTPAKDGRPRPVLFWMYGGSFFLGGTSLYDGGGILAYRQDAVIVSTNYRLGALGWLGGDAVARSTTDGSAGNFGLQDTREALLWVRRNIGAFNGDPSQISLFGESAGSSLVACHLVSPRSKDLFTGAIMESGAFDNATVQLFPETNFRAFADAMGCTNTAGDDAALACLRRQPMGLKFSEALGSTGGFGPTADHVELDASPEAYAMAGKINPVRGVLLGTNRDEGNFLMPLIQPVPNAPRSTKADVVSWLRGASPSGAAHWLTAAQAKRVTDEYALEMEASPWAAASAMYTDSQYLCPTHRSARWLAQSGAVPPSRVFVYRLLFESSLARRQQKALYWFYWCPWLVLRPPFRCDNVTEIPAGVGHAADVDLVWNNPKLNATDRVLSHTVADYWSQFAASGDPNTGAVTWPPYSEAGQNVTLELDVPQPSTARGLGAHRCQLWQDVNPQ
jgi:para-nitrobenzyl esterase